MIEENSTENISELRKQRIDKLNQLKELSIDVYPARFNRESEISQVKEKYFIEENIPEESLNDLITVAGRIKSKRQMGKAGFINIEDFTGSIQLYANQKTLDETDYKVFQNLDIGDIIGITGEPFRTKTNEPSLRAKKMTLLSKNLSPLPIVKEKDGKTFDAFADVETRYRKRYVDLIVNQNVKQDFIIRSKILHEIRQFFQERDFLEVETPMMQAVASGAAAKPFATHHNALDMPLFLRIAPELYLKRLIVGGFEKVFELNRNFRNEGISPKHNPEFTMMEVYQAYADYEDMMQLTEDLFLHLADKVLGKRKLPYGDEEIDLSTPWEKKSYLGIIKEKSGLDFESFLEEENPSFDKAKEMASSIGVDSKGLHTFWEVVDEVFSIKVEPTLIQPIFITHFPKAISPLAKEFRDNPLLVERFEPYITGREMGNAFSELNDPIEQQARFEEQIKQAKEGAEETVALDEDFIEALKVGMPPTGGLGIGIDRLIMLFTNSQTIKDVILFPLMRKK